MFFPLRLMLAIAAASTFLVTSALADNWVANRLYGPVEQLIGNQWQPLERGMALPDSRMVRTSASGRLTLTRGEETIELGPNTQIKIHDRAGTKPFTTVTQSFGTVSVEAQVEKVQHFEVQTPYLAAVVKGTRFTVTSGKSGATVTVHRGHVEVDDHLNRTHVTISLGQTASVDKVKTAGQNHVHGPGTLPKVLDAKGKPVVSKDEPPKVKPIGKDLGKSPEPLKGKVGPGSDGPGGSGPGNGGPGPGGPGGGGSDSSEGPGSGGGRGHGGKGDAY